MHLELLVLDLIIVQFITDNYNSSKNQNQYMLPLNTGEKERKIVEILTSSMVKPKIVKDVIILVLLV